MNITVQIHEVFDILQTIGDRLTPSPPGIVPGDYIDDRHILEMPVLGVWCICRPALLVSILGDFIVTRWQMYYAAKPAYKVMGNYVKVDMAFPGINDYIEATRMKYVLISGYAGAWLLRTSNGKHQQLSIIVPLSYDGAIAYIIAYVKTRMMSLAID